MLLIQILLAKFSDLTRYAGWNTVLFFFFFCEKVLNDVVVGIFQMTYLHIVQLIEKLYVFIHVYICVKA